MILYIKEPHQLTYVVFLLCLEPAQRFKQTDITIAGQGNVNALLTVAVKEMLIDLLISDPVC